MEKAAVIEDLKRVAAALAPRPMSRSLYQQHGTISSSGVEKTFGSWNEAIAASGLTPNPPGGRPRVARRAAGSPARIPDDVLLDELLRLATELGRRPSGNQVAAKSKYDSTIYQRRWGSIKAAYDLALRRGSS